MEHPQAGVRESIAKARGPSAYRNDALQTLKAAVLNNRYYGCGFQDGCFYDEDCETGYYCGIDPEWNCDAACVPE